MSDSIEPSWSDALFRDANRLIDNAVEMITTYHVQKGTITQEQADAIIADPYGPRIG